MRCSSCKAPIRIAQLDLEALTPGELIPATAKLARKKSSDDHRRDAISGPNEEAIDEPANAAEAKHATGKLQSQEVQPEDIAAARREANQVIPDPLGPATEPVHAASPLPKRLPEDVSEEVKLQLDEEQLQELDPVIQRVVKSPPRVPPVLHPRPWRKVQPLTDMEVEQDIEPISLKVGDPEETSSSSMAQRNSDSIDERRQVRDDFVEVSEPPEVPKVSKADASDLPDVVPAVTPVQEVAPVIQIDLAGDSESEEVVLDDAAWQQRLSAANDDRRTLSRVLAFFLLFLAMVNMVPAIVHWQNWSAMSEMVPLPRWIYLQIFVGAVYLIYSIFLVHISDWSALRSISVAMLVVAFLFGVVSTGLLVGTQGTMAGMLGIPFTLVRQAGIWCVSMLCLAVVMSIWAGKESSNWRRAELMLRSLGGSR